jgi:uncharacterized membrane protein YjjB (DUF3815 family)
LKTVSADASKSVPLVYWLGSNPAGLASEQYTSVLAACAMGMLANRAATRSKGLKAGLSI